MGYYHIKNIDINKRENYIAADLADSNWQPIEWFHVSDLSKDKSLFEEKYANFIYNLVSGNFHPISSNKYSKIVMNRHLHNYYEDAHDIGEMETYKKYKDNIDKIMTGKEYECDEIKSDRELNPEKYYILNKYNDSKLKFKGDYYTNSIGEIFCIEDNKLMKCDIRKTNYGYPIYEVYYDKDKYFKHNKFLNELEKNNGEISL